MEIGALCVMMDGQPLMPTWPADSSVFLDLVSIFAKQIIELVNIHIDSSFYCCQMYNPLFDRCISTQWCSLWTKHLHHHCSRRHSLHHSSIQID